ncbi:uncharacterized protein LOC144167071 isoform X1 [Haemaphysalis longicornis]
MTVIPPEATMEVTPKSTTDATMEFTTTVAQNATAPYTLGELPVSGLAFDLIFGTETTLNLASDVWMQVTLMSWQSPGTKKKLGLFLGWNALTTAVCYVASVFLADFRSRVVQIKPEEIEGFKDEAESRVCVLGCILKFFVDWKCLAEESGFQEGRAYPSGNAAAWPGAYPAQPGTYPVLPGTYPAPPGGFPAPGQMAYPAPYYVNPPQGAGVAPPEGYPQPKAVLSE